MHENYIKDTLSEGVRDARRTGAKHQARLETVVLARDWPCLALPVLTMTLGSSGMQTTEQVWPQIQVRGLMLEKSGSQGQCSGEGGQLLVISSQHYRSWGTGALSRDAEQSGAPRVHDIS